MNIVDYYFPTNSEFGITEKNQVAVLFKNTQTAPAELNLKERGLYKRVYAGTIPREMMDEGFINCQIYQFTGYIIYGVDKIQDSWKNLFINNESDLLEKCKDIVNNPINYSRHPNNSEDAYYKFIKYLWICKPNQQEIRLSDYVQIHI